MSRVRRIVLVRHGETDGKSSVRFHGAGDVGLSESGRAQMRQTAKSLRREVFDEVVSSTARRAWQSAALLAGGAPVRLEADFREIDFGRFEGMTAKEIGEQEPVLYREWQEKKGDFEFPEGEPRAAFRERVERGTGRLLASDAYGVLVVAHKGVMRAIVRKLAGEVPEDFDPPLGGSVGLSRQPDGTWILGRTGSNPPSLGQAA